MFDSGRRRRKTSRKSQKAIGDKPTRSAAAAKKTRRASAVARATRCTAACRAFRRRRRRRRLSRVVVLVPRVRTERRRRVGTAVFRVISVEFVVLWSISVVVLQKFCPPTVESRLRRRRKGKR